MRIRSMHALLAAAALCRLAAPPFAQESQPQEPHVEPPPSEVPS